MPTQSVEYALRYHAAGCSVYTRLELLVHVAYWPEVVSVTTRRRSNAHRVSGRIVFVDRARSNDDDDDGERVPIRLRIDEDESVERATIESNDDREFAADIFPSLNAATLQPHERCTVVRAMIIGASARARASALDCQPLVDGFQHAEHPAMAEDASDAPGISFARCVLDVRYERDVHIQPTSTTTMTTSTTMLEPTAHAELHYDIASSKNCACSRWLTQIVWPREAARLHSTGISASWRVY